MRPASASNHRRYARTPPCSKKTCTSEGSQPVGSTLPGSKIWKFQVLKNSRKLLVIQNQGEQEPSGKDKVYRNCDENDKGAKSLWQIRFLEKPSYHLSKVTCMQHILWFMGSWKTWKWQLRIWLADVWVRRNPEIFRFGFHSPSEQT